MKCSLLKYTAAAAGASNVLGGDDMRQSERCAAAINEFKAGLEPAGVQLDSAARTEPTARKADHEKALPNEEQRERQRRIGSGCQDGGAP